MFPKRGGGGKCSHKLSKSNLSYKLIRNVLYNDLLQIRWKWDKILIELSGESAQQAWVWLQTLSIWQLCAAVLQKCWSDACWQTEADLLVSDVCGVKDNEIVVSLKYRTCPGVCTSELRRSRLLLAFKNAFTLSSSQTSSAAFNSCSFWCTSRFCSWSRPQFYGLLWMRDAHLKRLIGLFCFRIFAVRNHVWFEVCYWSEILVFFSIQVVECWSM